MLIYEVNLTVENSIANEYASWLGEHIREMLQIDGFRAAAWYVEDAPQQEKEPAASRQWTIHYQVESREHLDTYFDEHAERMRQEGLDRFEGQFEASRRVLVQRQVFSS